MKYSMELLQKPVISADKNDKLGRINGFIIDPDTRVLSAYLLEPRPGQKSFVVVPFSNTKTIYHDAVIVENMSEPLPLDKAPHIMELFVRDVTLIGSQVITDTGRLAGEVRDFAFEIKTGALKRLRLDPQPGFPESFEMSLAIKLTKDRVMARGDIYDPNLAKSLPPKPKPASPPAAKPEIQPAPAPPKPAEAPQPQKKSSFGPAPAPPAAPKPPARKPAHESTQTPRVDAVRMQLLADELRKDLRQEFRDLSETVFKDTLRDAMQELSRMLLDRINALETGDKLDKTRQAIVSEITALLPEQPGADDADARRAAARQELEQALESKVAQKLQAAEERAAALEDAVRQLTESHARLAPDLADTIQSAVSPLRAALEDKDRAAEGSAHTIAAVEQAVAALGQTLGADIQALKSSALDAESLRAMLDAQTAKFQDRANALRQSFIDDVRELAVSIIEERLRAMADRVAADTGALREDIAGVPDAVKDAVRQFQARAAAFDTRLDAAGDAAQAVQALKTELSAALGKTADNLSQKLDTALEALFSRTQNGPDPAALEIRDAVMGITKNLDALRNDLGAQLTRTFERISQDWEQDRESAAMLQHEVRAALDAQARELNEKLQALAAEGGGARIQEFMDSAMDRLDQGLKALRHDFTGGPDGLGGLFLQQVERMDAAAGIHADKLAALQSESLERIDALAASMQSRFDGLLSALDDSLRREIAAFDENAAARAAEFKDILKKTREQFAGQLLSLSGERLEALKKDVLDEIRTYSAASVKSEDLVQARDWLDETIQSLMKSLARESEEKLGRALTQLNRFQEEIAMDTGQFKHEAQELRERLAETLDQKLSGALDDLQQRLDIERLRESVFAQIADTAKRTTEAARADIDHLQDLIRSILVAMEEARENEPDPGALRQGIEQFIGERLQDAAGRLEQRVAAAAGESVAAAVAVEQSMNRRDAALHKALDAIQETLEKLLSRGPGLSLGDVFGGGLMSVFGGRGGREGEPAPRAADETPRIGGSAAQQTRERKRPGPSGAVEAAQVRRLSYLLGKTVTRAIEDKDGNLIAGQGDTVDEGMIRAARDAHMVLDLIRAVDLSRK
mgnify:CR=1 FL=1